MNAIEKLFRKIPLRDKIILIDTLRILKQGQTYGLRIEKLSGSNFYKVRKGNFRFVFHYKNEGVVIDAVKLRNEKTYRGF